MRHWMRRLLAAGLVSAALAGGFWISSVLPDTYTVEQGQPLRLAAAPWLCPAGQPRTVAAAQPGGDTSSNTTLSLLGVVPVKTVRVVEKPRRTVTVCGTPFGIKIFSEGALVVGFSDVVTDHGSVNPAKSAGLCLGDLILSADGIPVYSNQELSAAISKAKGGSITLVYRRSGSRYTTQLCPVLDGTVQRWRAGMWVRDSSAGIGTLTFCCPETGAFGGLGHAISDTDTGEQVSVYSGRAAQVTITDFDPAGDGTPGQLKGEFGADEGTILANRDTGVYGILDTPAMGISCPVAWMQEVTPGEAKLVTTIHGGQPKQYDIRIERISLLELDPNRNMLIRVTDPELLAATGGILQGMSGSPILQNGKLVGAVTHVLLKDSTRGYAIFAEKMLAAADQLPQNAA